MLLKIKVTANKRENRVHGRLGNFLIVHTTSPREKGLANRSVLKSLSNFFSLPKDSISIKSGKTSVSKIIYIDDLYAGLVFEKLSLLS